MDEIVNSILKKIKKLGLIDETEFILFSEYGFNDVNEGIPINRILRENGLLATRTIKNKEYIDFEYSKAFALVDHQVAHIFVNKPEDKNYVKEILKDVQGIEGICDDEEKRTLKIDNYRSGILIAISIRDKWFSYYWWNEDEKLLVLQKLLIFIESQVMILWSFL